ncbi:MAG: tyrosine-type recombinase/integrase [Clostridia bacterium]|nr:tyrosine-type recombinase/integrase [Clostridia bacterium]
MRGRTVNEKSIKDFAVHLLREERSLATREKYLRDVRRFSDFVGGRAVDWQVVYNYKISLERDYAVASANSMLAALNAFFRFCGWQDLCVKQFKVQREAFCSEEKELTRAEYLRLVEAAQRKGDLRMSLIIQTICGTGIRVSELPFITVESAIRGEATVNCKGKTRRVFIVRRLQNKLLRYAKERGINTGSLFITREGKPMNRSCIWREMKRLCRDAGVPPSKVFPHNLRHLFARTFYEIEKDIAKLADILGHSSINTTRIYIVETGTEHRRRMENMRLII